MQYCRAKAPFGVPHSDDGIEICVHKNIIPFASMFMYIYHKRRPALESKQNDFFTLSSSKIFYNCFKSYGVIISMAEKEYKEKVKIDDDEEKIERESKDFSGNKVKEKHEVKRD